MSKKLGGILFIRNGIEFDYCYQESIKCLQELCDEVIVLDAGSDDGTKEDLLQFEDSKTLIVATDEKLWHSQKGKEKLAYFQNIALSFLESDYYFLLQGDEIIHEKSFPFIRTAIEFDIESFLVTRVNLWGDCDSFINVPPNRQPCSTQVIRLAKTKYQSAGDGESIDAIANPFYVDDIKIFHYGFVRKKEVMKAKIINMQEKVFQIDHDPKLDGSDTFDSTLWFSGNELSKLNESHPKFIQDWILTRP
jgi:glycosyltransferase involved in cell wall biosynthesis